MAALRGKERTLCVCLVVCLGLGMGRCDFLAAEASLRSALLTQSNYSVDIRPANTTDIAISAILLSLNNLNIAQQSMSVNILLIVDWIDPRLVWDPANYGGLEHLVIHPKHIWTPPFVIENAIEDVGVIGRNDDTVPIRVKWTGSASMISPTFVNTFCGMNIARYPFDTQTCRITIAAYSYIYTELNTTSDYIRSGVTHTPHGEFEVLGSRISHITVGIGRRVIHMDITLRRRWQFYGQNVLLPIVVNSVLMNAVFLLPIESGEKMGFSLTVLLSYTFFLTLVTDNLPPISTQPSILQIYMALVLCLGCLATLLTTWVVSLHHRCPERTVGTFYRQVAVCVLRPFYTWTHRVNNNKKQTNVPRNDKVTMLEVQKSPLAQKRLSAWKTIDNKEDKRASATSGSDVMEGGGNVVEGEVTSPDFTWTELAVLFDYFFFGVFAFIMCVITTVIFALLYTGY